MRAHQASRSWASADGDPDPVLVGVVEGQVAHAGVFRRPDPSPVLDAGVAAMA